MDFMVAPEALKVLNHELGVDKNVLRWMTVKRPERAAIRAADTIHADRTASPLAPQKAVGAEPPPAG
jgi:ribosomal protein S6